MFNGYNENPLIPYEFDQNKEKKQENVSKWTYESGAQPSQSFTNNRQSECWSGKHNFSGLPNAVNISPKCNCSGCYSSSESHSYQGDSTRHRPWLPKSFPVSLNVSGDSCKLPEYHQWDEQVVSNQAQSLCFSEEALSTSQYSQDLGGKPFYYRHYSSMKQAEVNHPAVITSIKNIDVKNNFLTKHKTESLTRGNTMSYDQNATRQPTFCSTPYNTSRHLERKIDSRNCTFNFCGSNEKCSNIESYRHGINAYSIDHQMSRIPAGEPYMKTVPSLINQNRVPLTGHRNAKESMPQSYIDQNFNDSRRLSCSNSVNGKKVYQSSFRKNGTIAENFMGEQLHTLSDSSLFENAKNKVLQVDQRPFNGPLTYDNTTITEASKSRFENTRQTDYCSRNNVADICKGNNENFSLENRKDCTLGQINIPDQYHGDLLSYNQVSNISKYSGLSNNKNLDFDSKEFDEKRLSKMEKFEQFTESPSFFQRHVDPTNNENIHSRLLESASIFNGPSNLRFPDRIQNALTYQNSPPNCRNYLQSEFLYQGHTSQDNGEFSHGISEFRRSESNHCYQRNFQHQILNCNSEQFTPSSNNSYTCNPHYQQPESAHKILPQHFYLNKSQSPSSIQVGSIPHTQSENLVGLFKEKKMSSLETIQSDEVNKNNNSKISPLRLLRKKKFVNQKNEDFREANCSLGGGISASKNPDSTPDLDVRKFWSTWAEVEEENAAPTQMIVLDCQNIDPEQAKFLQLYESEPVRTTHFENDDLFKTSDKEVEQPVQIGTSAQEIRPELEQDSVLNKPFNEQIINKQISENHPEIIQQKETLEIEKLTENVLPLTTPNVSLDVDTVFETDCRLLGDLPVSQKATPEGSTIKSESKHCKKGKTAVFQAHKEVNRNRKISLDGKTDELKRLDKWTEKKFDFLKRAEESKAAEILRHEEEKKKIFEKRLAFQQSNISNERKKENFEIESEISSINKRKEEDDERKGNNIISEESFNDNSQSNSPVVAHTDATDLPTSEYRRNKFLQYSDPKTAHIEIPGSETVECKDIFKGNESQSKVSVTDISNDLPTSNGEDFKIEKVVKQEFPSKKVWTTPERCSYNNFDNRELHFSSPNKFAVNNLKIKSETDFPNSGMENVLNKITDTDFQNFKVKSEKMEFNEKGTDEKFEGFGRIKASRNKRIKKKKKFVKELEKGEKMNQVTVDNISVSKPTIKFSIQKSHDLKISFKVLNSNNKKYELSDCHGEKEEKHVQNVEKPSENSKNGTELITLKLKSFKKEISQRKECYKLNKDFDPKKGKKKLRRKKEHGSKSEMKTPILKIKKSRYMTVEEGNTRLVEESDSSQKHSSEDSSLPNVFHVKEMIDSAKIKLTFKRNKSNEEPDCTTSRHSEGSSGNNEEAAIPSPRENFQTEYHRDMFQQSSEQCDLNKFVKNDEGDTRRKDFKSITSDSISNVSSKEVESNEENLIRRNSLEVFKENPLENIVNTTEQSISSVQNEFEKDNVLNDKSISTKKRKELEIDEVYIPKKRNDKIETEYSEAECITKTADDKEIENTKVIVIEDIPLECNENLNVKEVNKSTFESLSSEFRKNEIRDEAKGSIVENGKELDLKSISKFRTENSHSVLENTDDMVNTKDLENGNTEKSSAKSKYGLLQSKEQSFFDGKRFNNFFEAKSSECNLDNKRKYDVLNGVVYSQKQSPSTVLFDLNEAQTDNDIPSDYIKASTLEDKQKSVLNESEIQNLESSKNSANLIKTASEHESTLNNSEEVPLLTAKEKDFDGLKLINLSPSSDVKPKEISTTPSHNSSLEEISFLVDDSQKLKIDETDSLKNQGSVFNKNANYCLTSLETVKSNLESDIEEGEIIDDSSIDEQSVKSTSSVPKEVIQKELISEFDEVPKMLTEEKDNIELLIKKRCFTENTLSTSNCNNRTYLKMFSKKIKFKKNKIQRRHSVKEENLPKIRNFQKASNGIPFSLFKKRAISCPPDVQFFKEFKNFVPEIPVEEIPLPLGDPLPENCFDFISYFNRKKVQNEKKSFELKTELISNDNNKMEESSEELVFSNNIGKTCFSQSQNSDKKISLNSVSKDFLEEHPDDGYSQNLNSSSCNDNTGDKSKEEDFKNSGLKRNFKVKFSIAKRKNFKLLFPKIEDDESEVFKTKKKCSKSNFESSCECVNLFKVFPSETTERQIQTKTAEEKVKVNKFDSDNFFHEKLEIPSKLNNNNASNKTESARNDVSVSLRAAAENKKKENKEIGENQENMSLEVNTSECLSKKEFTNENITDNCDDLSLNFVQKKHESENESDIQRFSGIEDIEINIEEGKSNYDRKSSKVGLNESLDIESFELGDIETLQISNTKPIIDINYNNSDYIRGDFYEFEDIPTSEDLPSEDENLESDKVADDDKFRNIMQTCLDNAKKFLNVGNLKLFSCSVEDLLEVDSQIPDTPSEESEPNKSAPASNNHISRDVLLTSCEDTMIDDLDLPGEFQPTDITMDFVPSFSANPHSLCPEILPVDNWPYLEEEVPSSPSKTKTEENDLIFFLENVSDNSRCPPKDFGLVGPHVHEDFYTTSQKVNPEKSQKQILLRNDCSNFKRVRRKSLATNVELFRKCLPLGVHRRKTISDLNENFITSEKSTRKFQDFRNEVRRLKNVHRKTERSWSNGKSLKCRLSLEKLSGKNHREGKSESTVEPKNKGEIRPDMKLINDCSKGSKITKTQVRSLIREHHGCTSEGKISIDYKSPYWQPKVVLFRISKKDLYKRSKKSGVINQVSRESNSDESLKEIAKKREIISRKSFKNLKFKESFEKSTAKPNLKIRSNSWNNFEKSELEGEEDKKVSLTERESGYDKPRVLNEILKGSNGVLGNVTFCEKDKKIGLVKRSYTSVSPKENPNLIKRKKSRFRNLHAKKKSEPLATNFTKDISTAQDVVPKVSKLVNPESDLDEIFRGGSSPKEITSQLIVKSTKEESNEKQRNLNEKKKKKLSEDRYDKLKSCTVSSDSFDEKHQSTLFNGKKDRDIEYHAKKIFKRDKSESSDTVINDSNILRSEVERRKEKNESRTVFKHTDRKTHDKERNTFRLESSHGRSKSKKKTAEGKTDAKDSSVKSPEKIKPMPRKSEDKENNKIREDEVEHPWVCEVCGFGNVNERVTHIKSHPFHCQSCHLAFKTEAHFVNHLTKKHKDIRNQHHCLLCELSFDTEDLYLKHLETREHRHLESVEKNTINTLFTLLTGQPCPVLGLVEMKPEWLPSQAGTVHFYHQATPLSLALQIPGIDPGELRGPVSVPKARLLRWKNKGLLDDIPNVSPPYSARSIFSW